MVPWTVTVGLLCYVLLTLGIGVYAGRRVKGSQDFIVAGRRLGIVLATGTLAATWFGGGIVIGAASAAYQGGFLGVIADPFGAALCLILAGLFYVRMMRRMGLTTIAEFFTIRFGQSAGTVAALCTIPTYVGWVASLMVAFGRIIQTLTGFDATLAIVVGAAIVLIYTTAGGMWAVTLTDFVQVGVLIIALLVLTPIILADMGGWTAIRSQLPDEQFYLYPHSSEWMPWFHYARDWLVIGLGNLAGQDLIQRSLSSRDEKVAQNSAYLSAILYLTIGLIPVFLGIAAKLVFPNLEDPDMVMMKLGQTYLPTFGLAIFLGALVSALMSSADSALLAPASVIASDLAKHISPNISENRQLQICRICIPVLGIVALYLALSKNTIYSLMVDSWSVLLATLFVPLTAGIWWSKANRLGALWSMIVGAVSWQIFMRATPDLPADLMAVPFGLITLVLISHLTADKHPPKPLQDASGKVLSYKDRLGLLGISSKTS